MDTNIYYIPKYQGISITSNFAEIQRQMDIGLEPKIEYIPIAISDLSKYKIRGLGFEKIQDEYFQSIKNLFSGLKLEAVSFHESNIDLSDVTIHVQHLLIGEKSKVNLSNDNFKDLEEVTFLSLKSFKGKVLNQLDTVEKAVLWDSPKGSSLPEMFPNLKELTINKGALIKLDLRNNKDLEKLDVHLCTKLEQILLPDQHKLKEVFIENCKNLNVNNLPPSVTRVWPPRKEKVEKRTADVKLTSTGNQHIDFLILDLKKNMEDYMNDADPSYTQADIDECASILIDYAINMLATKSKEDGMEIVKSTVLKLNTLNEKCDYSLIETNEREQIAEIIILTGSELGYNTVNEDVTEEWREW
ncbi:hypothetical protein [Chryseobacterium sp.]|uniref:hypothetical protein n=1 Tax=Chryseobacterium sp. TaxID=1871047 RepID=UPI0025B7D5A3|nr:hypothetical protein [Chryseobacterium sp.]MBV8327824.1 hypothetical protein [Chryseobacterium sp.]